MGVVKQLKAQVVVIGGDEGWTYMAIFNRDHVIGYKKNVEK